MNSFWMMTAFEYKKLMKRKITWITLLVLVAVAMFSACTPIIGDYFVNGVRVDSNYNMLRTDIAYARELSGRKIDDALLKEAGEAYAKVPDVSLYVDTEEYQTYARPYSEIFNWVRQARKTTGIETVKDLQNVNEERLYKERAETMQSLWEESGYSPKEIRWLMAQEDKVEKPIVFAYNEGCDITASLMYTLGIMQALLIAICVPGIFSEEHVRKTSPLLLTSAFGKRKLYLAKLFTGVTFSLGTDLLLCAAVILPTLLIYGGDGFFSQIQTLNPLYPWNLTAGQAVLILIGITLASSLLYCGAVCVLGEKCKSSIPAIAVALGFILAGMLFNIPDTYPLASQIWDCIPINMAAVWGAFSDNLIPLFGRYFTQWQIAPAVYIALFFLLAVLGAKIYTKTNRN
ncbi:MAG TPA: ABC transporter permease [Candidatus Blautia faecigallinarum]|uniref:ABC transporter permease n=1 Tax=Candidatus Blautia faecigallinarum TaxID=2838488 RepID=A0A9D2DRU5_9FIRM|nr:ABC transporter permease [Candidatus Blautia faecigallinarum]